MSSQNHKSIDEQIAIFRYGIIAPVIHQTASSQTQYLKEIAKSSFDVPGYGRKKYSWKTFIDDHSRMIVGASWTLAEANPSFKKWLDSFKQNPQESCLYFFDESEFKKYYAHQLFLPITEPDRIYLINHRKLLDIIQFLRTRIDVDYAFPLFIDQAEYVLASSVRLFDLNEDNYSNP